MRNVAYSLAVCKRRQPPESFGVKRCPGRQAEGKLRVVYVKLCKLAGVCWFFYSSPDDGGVSRGGQVPGGAGAALLRILAAMFSNLNHGWSQGGRGPVSSLSGGKVTAAAFWLGPAATFFILSRSILLTAPLLIFPAYFPFPPLPEADTGLFS